MAQPAVVYIPGFGSHSGDVLSTRLRRGIAERRRVLTPDNRGAGRTKITGPTSVTVATLAEDVAALMDAEGIESAHIFGYSMGGAIALTFALMFPHRVRSLMPTVTLAASEDAPRAAWILEAMRLVRDEGTPTPLINRLSALYLLPDEVFRVAPFMDAWITAPPDPYVQTRTGFDMQAQAMLTYDVRDRLAAISAPTLVISSPDDTLVPPHLQDALVTGIPQAQIARYRGGHIFMALPDMLLEALAPGSARYLDDMSAFWNAHDSGPGQ